MSDEGVEQAMLAFEKAIEEQERRQKRRRNTDETIRARKAEHLLPFRKLLRRFDDMRIVVHNSDRFIRPQPTEVSIPQVFRVYEAESSDSWAPGTSLFFDHPAQVEIAIPNERDQDVLGVVVIRSASEHPDQNMLQGPFRNADEALIALSSFIARSTVRVDAPGPGSQPL